MNPYAVFPLFSSVLLVILGGLVLGRSQVKATNRILSVLTFIFAYWAFTEAARWNAQTSREAQFWLRTAFLWPLSVSVYFHLVLVFTRRTAPATGGKILLFGALYLPGVALALVELLGGGLLDDPVRRHWGWESVAPRLNVLYGSALAWAGVCAMLSVYLLVDYHRRVGDKARRNQVRAVVIGVVLLSAAGLSTSIAGRFFGVDVPQVLLSLAGFVALGIASLVWRQEVRSLTPASAAEDIISIMADSLILVGPEDRILRMNKAAGILLGYSENELVGSPVGRIFERGSYDSVLFRDSRLRELERAGFFADIGTIFVSKSGRRIPVSVSESLLTDSRGRRIGLVLLARDLTERRRIEEELQRAQKLDSLSKLARGVAHDFNNILTAVLGNISLGRMRSSRGSELYKLLRSAEKAALLAKGLSRQLLTFTRGGDPIKELVSVAKLVRDTVEFAMRGSNIRSEFSIPGDLKWADLDREQIGQVVSNLIINAKQAMLRGGTVRVGCWNAQVEEGQVANLELGEYVAIRVQDTGVGIQNDNLDKIFDPFFTTKAQGSGLGLAISYSIVQKHGGTITAESVEGAGSAFTVYLPAVEQVGEAEDTRFLRLTPGEARILVMDDDDVVRLTFQNILIDLGYTVRLVVDGEEAVRTYRDAKETGEPFDLVIMDLVIPGGLGGKEAIGTLQQFDPRVRAIVTSGYSDDPVMARYREYGFCGVLPKPFRIDEVSRVIEEALRVRR